MAVEPLVVRVPFQSWVMVWPEARVQVTVQPLIAEAPAVTVISPWKPPGQELTVRNAAPQVPVGGGGDGGGDEGGGEDGGGEDGGGEDGTVEGDGEFGGGEVGGPSSRVGVVQSRQSARLPDFRLEIRMTPAALPVLSRNFCRFCCSGVRHSLRTAQCVPSATSDQ
ncbi:hypothetical protein ACFQY4_36875 [Catellatospora bangladeshensis]|uniref:hypothetical protein n=1 Tax=Catellatospora bangladeshensis TaxID=310355 RepID=UPI00361390E5